MQIFIDSIRKDIESLNWHGALALSLTLPDICGKIEDPTINGSERRFVSWFDKYILSKYELGEDNPTRQRRGLTHLLSGGDVYALRCSYLHEGSDDISAQRAKEVFDRFRFSSRPGIHCNVIQIGGIAIVQLNIANFCNDVISGVEQWLKDIAGDPIKQAKVSSRINIDLDPHQPGGITFGPVVDREISNTRVILDGNKFIRCIFTNCEMVFNGTAPVIMEGCTVRASCTFHLEGNGSITANFLSNLHRDGAGPIVEGIFEQIRRGPIQPLAPPIE